MTTKEKIFSKALELFNNEGVEYVGMRELAAHLNMRVSNITYYYPTKDDLVFAISQELNKLNSAIVVQDKKIDIASFLSMLNEVFHNHVQFKCLMLSFVHLMEQNPLIKQKYRQTESVRNTALRDNLNDLKTNGSISYNSPEDAEYILSSLSLIIRFWISEVTVSQSRMHVELQIAHYLKIIAKMLEPFATKKGKKEMNAFLKLLETKSKK